MVRMPLATETSISLAGSTPGSSARTMYRPSATCSSIGIVRAATGRGDTNGPSSQAKMSGAKPAFSLCARPVMTTHLLPVPAPLRQVQRRAAGGGRARGPASPGLFPNDQWRDGKQLLFGRADRDLWRVHGAARMAHPGGKGHLYERDVPVSAAGPKLGHGRGRSPQWNQPSAKKIWKYWHIFISGRSRSTWNMRCKPSATGS